MKAILMICSSLKILKMSRLSIRKRRLQQRAYRRRRRIDILGMTIFLSFLFVQMVFLLQEVFGKGRGVMSFFCFKGILRIGDTCTRQTIHLPHTF